MLSWQQVPTYVRVPLVYNMLNYPSKTLCILASYIIGVVFHLCLCYGKHNNISFVRFWQEPVLPVPRSVQWKVGDCHISLNITHGRSSHGTQVR